MKKQNKNVRTSIVLPGDQEEFLSGEAARLGKSKAEIVRLLIERAMPGVDPTKRIKARLPKGALR